MRYRDPFEDINKIFQENLKKTNKVPEPKKTVKVPYQSESERWSKLLVAKKLSLLEYERVPARERGLKPQRWHDELLYLRKVVKQLNELCEGLQTVIL